MTMKGNIWAIIYGVSVWSFKMFCSQWYVPEVSVSNPALDMNIDVFWNVQSGRNLLTGKRNILYKTCTLRTQAVSFRETPVNVYQNTRRHVSYTSIWDTALLRHSLAASDWRDEVSGCGLSPARPGPINVRLCKHCVVPLQDQSRRQCAQPQLSGNPAVEQLCRFVVVRRRVRLSARLTAMLAPLSWLFWVPQAKSRDSKSVLHQVSTTFLRVLSNSLRSYHPILRRHVFLLFIYLLPAIG